MELRETDVFEAATSWPQRSSRKTLTAADARVVRSLAALRVAAQRAENAAGAWVAQNGLTGAKFALLLTLATSDGAIRLSDIRRRLGTTQANITGLVAGLERDGFVRRNTSETDRRVTFLRLSPTGRRAFDSALPDYLVRGRSALRVLSAREQESLVDLLAKLARGLDAAR
ncbi:MAG: MarR family winged helix-turn-helix transcriptional regulator [Vulcanimicrobiaceae bacterium]